jgi:hypothetical protein
MITITCVVAKRKRALFQKCFSDSLRARNEVMSVLEYRYKTTG